MYAAPVCLSVVCRLCKVPFSYILRLVTLFAVAIIYTMLLWFDCQNCNRSKQLICTVLYLLPVVIVENKSILLNVSVTDTCCF